MPVLPWQRPPVTRNVNGRWRPGVSGNRRGRPTNARLAAKRAAGSYVAQLKRLASYEGLTGDYFVRLARIVYGCTDPKAGYCGTLANVPDDARLNHRCRVEGGLLAEESSGLLQQFFRSKR